MFLKKISSFDISIVLVYIFQAFLYLIFLSTSISLTSFNFIIFLVLCIFLGIGIVMLFCYLFSLSNKSIFYNIKSKFIIFILISIVFLFACFSIKMISNYISFIYLKDMNIFIIMGSLILSIFFLIKKDICSFFRCSTLIFYFYLLLEILSFILLCFYFKVHNILPVTFDINNILDHSYLYLVFIVLPILFLLMVPRYLIRDNKVFSKKIFITYIIISIIISIKSIMSISILGYNSIDIYKYIDVVTYKNINLFTFIERIEWLLCFNSITNMFFLISLSMFYIKEGLNYILPIKKKSYIYPLLICMFVLIFGYLFDFSLVIITWIMILFFFIHLFYALFKLLK